MNPQQFGKDLSIIIQEHYYTVKLKTFPSEPFIKTVPAQGRKEVSKLSLPKEGRKEVPGHQPHPLEAPPPALPSIIRQRSLGRV